MLHLNNHDHFITIDSSLYRTFFWKFFFFYQSKKNVKVYTSFSVQYIEINETGFTVISSWTISPMYLTAGTEAFLYTSLINTGGFFPFKYSYLLFHLKRLVTWKYRFKKRRILLVTWVAIFSGSRHIIQSLGCFFRSIRSFSYMKSTFSTSPKGDMNILIWK